MAQAGLELGIPSGTMILDRYVPPGSSYPLVVLRVKRKC